MPGCHRRPARANAAGAAGGGQGRPRRLRRGKDRLREPAQALRDGAVVPARRPAFSAAVSGRARAVRTCRGGQGPRGISVDGRPAGAERHGGAGVRPDRPGRAGTISGPGRLARSQLHRRPHQPRHRLHPAGPEHGPLRDLGRHAGDRLSPVSARGRSAADRLHGQQRRRHANQLPDGARQPHSLCRPKLLPDEPAEAVGHQRSAGLGTAPVQPIDFSHGPCRLHHDAGHLARADLLGHQGLFRHRRHLGHLPLRQAALHPDGLRRTRRPDGKRRRTQLQHPATRSRRPLDVALAARQESGDHRSSDQTSQRAAIPMPGGRQGDVAPRGALGIRSERGL